MLAIIHKAANNGESVLETPRAMARLRIAGKKTKETLSANQETPVNVEALSNDIDFRTTISREEFNKILGPRIKLDEVVTKIAGSFGAELSWRVGAWLQ